ncbi:TonB-dependent receptor, partial [candidate division WOR-3 bacterium]|nr:TonB-dependent receptor [candidate division WOR-3 bacterium]
IGNPELGYEHTATYEMGVVHYLLSNLYIDITGYYKDITGLVGIEQLPVSLNFYYLNEDYANAKGFEVTIRKEPGGDLGYLSGIINFTYSSAVGQNSFKVRDPSQIWGDYKREFPEFPMDWDERIRINAHLILSIPEDRSLFNLNWLNNFSIGIITEYGSGFPYTTILKQTRVVRINDGRLPSRFTLDMRLRKTFTVKNASIELFTDIQNLFNNHRLLRIADLAWYNSTGDPEGPFRDPTVWERARHIRLGLGVNF